MKARDAFVGKTISADEARVVVVFRHGLAFCEPPFAWTMHSWLSHVERGESGEWLIFTPRHLEGSVVAALVSQFVSHRAVTEKKYDVTKTRRRSGGEGGIRTHEGLAALPVFETGPFNHSGTSP